MAKINKHIEIVTSTQKGLSSMSPKSGVAVQAALAKYYLRVGITIVNNLANLRQLVADEPDLVFLGMKFVPSDPALGLRDPNKIWLSQFLDDYGIAYTGSGHLAHRLELNKDLAKQRANAAGLRTARSQVVPRGTRLTANNITLNYPVFIKPTNRGGGLGVDSASLAHNFDQLQAKVTALATSLGSDSLIEEYLPGREFSVGILRDASANDYWVMPIELVAPSDEFGRRILSGQVKSADSEHNLPVTDKSLRAKLNSLALDVFHALGAQDYGRIDIRLDGKATPHFLEANLLPSLLNNYGNFPKTCLLNMGLRYEPMLLTIVQLALARPSKLASNLGSAAAQPALYLPAYTPA